MKNLVFALPLALMCSAAFAVEPTCAAPGGPITTATVSNITGNTCASDSNLTSLCKGGQSVFGPQSVYLLTVGASNNFSVSVAGTAPYDTHSISKVRMPLQAKATAKVRTLAT